MDDAALARRFGAIEDQLTLISERLGLECPPFAGTAGPRDGVVPAEVLELVRGGRETQAISRLRQLTGMTLVEAKRVVDGL
jgi:hypothetical protein